MIFYPEEVCEAFYSIAAHSQSEGIAWLFTCYRPALVLLTSTNMSRDGYQGRISVSGGHVALQAVTGADEGSYTVRDADGEIKIKLCLNVRGERRQGPFPCLTRFTRAGAPLCQDVVALSL